MTDNPPELFDDVFDLPSPERKRQYEQLVGLGVVQSQLTKEATLLLHPEKLAVWSQKFHKQELPAIREFHGRPPLIVFSGDVGTGKTSLADSFGDPLARSEGLKVRVYRLGLMARGRGAVGEMTNLVTKAFAEIESAAQAGAKTKTATIFILDEADALVSSRSTAQMHHEDRAGVNAVIRGIDRLTGSGLPVLILMCTNREGALDPAVLRRAAAHFQFDRPSAEQRADLLKRAFNGILSAAEIDQLVELTGARDGRDYGFTFSDMTRRLIPGIVLSAFPDRAIDFSLAASIGKSMSPTRPFGQSEPEAA